MQQHLENVVLLTIFPETILNFVFVMFDILLKAHLYHLVHSHNLKRLTQKLIKAKVTNKIPNKVDLLWLGPLGLRIVPTCILRSVNIASPSHAG